MERKDTVKAIAIALSLFLMCVSMAVGYTLAAHRHPIEVRNSAFFSEQGQPEDPLIRGWVQYLGGDPETVTVRYDTTVYDQCQSVITIDGEGLAIPEEILDKGNFTILYRKPVYSEYLNSLTFTNARISTAATLNTNVILQPDDYIYKGYEGERMLLFYNPTENTVVYSKII